MNKRSIKKNCSAGMAVILIMAVCGAVLAGVQAATLTAEQIQMFQQLPSEQQDKLRNSFSSKMPTAKAEPLVTPVVVKPFEGHKGAPDKTLNNSAELPPISSNEPLIPFGYDLFAGSPTTFSPVTEIPIPIDYVIGPGDTVQVQLFGKENAEYE